MIALFAFVLGINVSVVLLTEMKTAPSIICILCVIAIIWLKRYEINRWSQAGEEIGRHLLSLQSSLNLHELLTLAENPPKQFNMVEMRGFDLLRLSLVKRALSPYIEDISLSRENRKDLLAACFRMGLGDWYELELTKMNL